MIVDATQGIEAQTLANLYLALDADLVIVPVINKIDLPAADVERIREEIDADLGLDPFEAIPISAKKGIGIDEVEEAIGEHEGDPDRDEHVQSSVVSGTVTTLGGSLSLSAYGRSGSQPLTM